jgi:hypothetical protein
MNRTIFFNEIRQSLFRGALTQPQVDGIKADLDYWEANYPSGNPNHLAYILATEYHETGAKMQPVPENGGKQYLTRMYDITGDRPAKARELGNTEQGDGARFTGGKTQLTGRSNFRKLGKRLEIPLEEEPERIYDMETSTAVLFVGMMEGLFTGKSLSRYTDLGGNLDAINARRVVNGTDRAALIAGYHNHFLAAVEAAYAAVPEEPQQQPQAPETDPVTPFESHLPPDWEAYQAFAAEKRLKATSKPPVKSKIILGAAATLISMALARYGLDVPPETLINITQGIASAGLTLIGIFRLFFTKTPVRM